MATKPHMDDLEAVRKVVDALADFELADKERILRWAREKLGLSPTARDTASASAAAPNLDTGAAMTHGTLPAQVAAAQGQDIRSFVAAKNPASDIQFAATIAYYFRFEAPPHLRKESITADDLTEACRQVNRDRMPRPAQTLVNAHSQGLLNRGERGTYVINTVGENLVAMALPSNDTPRAGGKARKRSAGKVAAKKRTSKGAKRIRAQ